MSEQIEGEVNSYGENYGKDTVLKCKCSDQEYHKFMMY